MTAFIILIIIIIIIPLTDSAVWPVPIQN
jgi:hypothetical protein